MNNLFRNLYSLANIYDPLILSIFKPNIFQLLLFPRNAMLLQSLESRAFENNKLVGAEPFASTGSIVSVY